MVSVVIPSWLDLEVNITCCGGRYFYLSPLCLETSKLDVSTILVLYAETQKRYVLAVAMLCIFIRPEFFLRHFLASCRRLWYNFAFDFEVIFIREIN